MKPLAAALVLARDAWPSPPINRSPLSTPYSRAAKTVRPKPPTKTFVPGETIYFSCQAEGYRKVDKPDDYGKQNVSLKYQIEVRDKGGALLKPVQEGKVETTVTQEDKDWKPKFRDTIVVPPLADTGDYIVLVKLSDELAKANIEKTAVFHIKGRDVAPSDTLIVRNFRFLRGEDDTRSLCRWPLIAPAIPCGPAST